MWQVNAEEKCHGKIDPYLPDDLWIRRPLSYHRPAQFCCHDTRRLSFKARNYTYKVHAVSEGFERGNGPHVFVAKRQIHCARPINVNAPAGARQFRCVPYGFLSLRYCASALQQTSHLGLQEPINYRADDSENAFIASPLLVLN